MKKMLLLSLCSAHIMGMQKSTTQNIPVCKILSLRALCLEFIYKNKIPRTVSANNLLEQVHGQENVYEFYLSQELTTTSLTVIKLLLEKEVPVQPEYRIIPALFQRWCTSLITKWKSAGALESLTSLITMAVEKKQADRKELLDALNLVLKEQPASYALPEFLIQVPLEKDLSDYSYGNVIAFPPCKQVPSLELKQFMKVVIAAKLQPELKNSMLRRAVHQKIAHGQAEYEPIICYLIENGADKTILSTFEQNNLICAT